MSPLHVGSEVCMVPFHVRSKVCIAPFQVRSKSSVFAPHIEGSNADLAPQMKGSHVDFALYMERRKSSRDQKIPFLPMFENIFSNNYILEVYMTYLITFENNKNKSTFNAYIEVSANTLKSCFTYLKPCFL